MAQSVNHKPVWILISDKDFDDERFHPLIYTELKQAEIAFKWIEKNSDIKHRLATGYLVDTSTVN